MKRWYYWVLPAVSRSYPHAKGTLPMCYSPFRHSTRFPKETFACDLHALATPPAFDLSQDQTRHLMTCLETPKSFDSFDHGCRVYLGATRHVFVHPVIGTTKAKLKILITWIVTRILSRQPLARGAYLRLVPLSSGRDDHKLAGHILATAPLFTFQKTLLLLRCVPANRCKPHRLLN